MQETDQQPVTDYILLTPTLKSGFKVLNVRAHFFSLKDLN